MTRPDRPETATATAPGWDAALYQDRHSFVWKHAAGLLDVLAPQPGERVLDLGCGTGQLAGQIATSGAVVVGVDNSPEMVEQARRNFPDLRFEVADATAFDAAPLGGPFDAVFSNAVLHWVKPPEAAADRVWLALKPGGRFVAEFGGKGNVRRIRTALRESMEELHPGSFDALDPWYFPSVGEYSTLLERRGFDVLRAMLFDRPTPLDAGEQGMANWVRMFGGPILAPLGPGDRERLIDATCRRLRPALFDEREGRWTADYRRLWVEAHRLSKAGEPTGGG